ncbi:hypothetical protein [Rhodococcus jostii]|uniref:hypothetical protein n=1 Tax=Rhodococcus jostii TaxID=132919 RepID=UPI00142F343C|nr:hypothetical protein [Rhodococcus jostii]
MDLPVVWGGDVNGEFVSAPVAASGDLIGAGRGDLGIGVVLPQPMMMMLPRSVLASATTWPLGRG